MILGTGDAAQINKAIDVLNKALIPQKKKLEEAERKLKIYLKKLLYDFHWVESVIKERFIKEKFVNDLKTFYRLTTPALIYF